MMDRVVPGGVAADLGADGATRIRETLQHIRQRFPRLIELYDNTASLQDRTAGTGIVRAELARQFGAPGYVGRASGRNFDARKTPGYAPYDELEFAVPVLTAGDVNARVWIRIREVEQSLELIEQILARLPDGPIASRLGGQQAKDWGSSKGSAATCWSGCGSTAGASRAVTCAIRRGFNGRCSKPQSKATSSPTSRSATNRSIARIRGTISDAQDIVRKPDAPPADRSAAAA